LAIELEDTAMPFPYTKIIVEDTAMPFPYTKILDRDRTCLAIELTRPVDADNMIELG
jgi:hypothetical protein